MYLMIRKAELFRRFSWPDRATCQ